MPLNSEYLKVKISFVVMRVTPVDQRWVGLTISGGMVA